MFWGDWSGIECIPHSCFCVCAYFLCENDIGPKQWLFPPSSFPVFIIFRGDNEGGVKFNEETAALNISLSLSLTHTHFDAFVHQKPFGRRPVHHSHTRSVHLVSPVGFIRSSQALVNMPQLLWLPCTEPPSHFSPPVYSELLLRFYLSATFKYVSTGYCTECINIW